MSNSPYVRSAMAQAALHLVPPLIRRALLDESAFRDEYGFKTEAVLTFGDSGVSIQRSELFDAIRRVLSGASELEVTDIDGREWKLRIKSETGELPTLEISSGDQRLTLPNFAVLSPDSETRLRSLDEAALDVNLPASARESWRSILSERALEGDEVDGFHSDIRDTPVHIGRWIRSEIKAGKSSVSSLVPSSRRYFERLVGAYDGSATIGDYATGSGRAFFEQLFAWRPYDGFLFSLFLSSHSAMTAEVVIEHLGEEDLIRVLDFLGKYGDKISQLGAIEVALRILPEKPKIEPLIIHLIEQIRDDDVDASAKGLKLFSALFVLVDEELSRTRLMSEEPPFYRRLASLSQAALIHRQLMNSDVDDTFFEWVVKNRGEQYYLQSLVDMRLEPRWNPDLAAASQMKADFFGRIMIAATKYEESIKGREIHSLILGEEPSCLQALSKFPYPFYPGPLEGAENSSNRLPDKILEVIEAKLKADEVGPSSFIALINSAMIFRVDSSQAELAAKALKFGNYRLASLEDKSQLLSILNGLATIATVTRSHTLADELRILARKYRRDSQYGFSIWETVRICLVAAASRADLNDWREFTGDWLLELAFGELESDDGKVLHSQLQILCHAVPELWVPCSKADAALKAFNAKA